MPKLSVIVITCNEASNIERCLRSVSWANELIVVDSNSTDGTVDLAKKCGARVINHEWQGYGAAKQAALEAATGDWVLSLDADEEISPNLQTEIREVLKQEPSVDGFTMPRLTWFLSRWVKHCGWYPDRLLRLFRRSKARFETVQIHERVVVTGSIGQLKGDILHYSYPDLETYFRKFNRYTTMGAEQLAHKGVRAGFMDIVIRPCVAFIKHYISKRGFLDGMEGFLVSVLSSMAVLVKYAKLRRLNRSSVPGQSE